MRMSHKRVFCKIFLSFSLLGGLFPFCSEFADIFDLEHFKSVLVNDVRVVSALPSTHLMTRPVEGSPLPHATPSWIRSHYLRRVCLFSLLEFYSCEHALSCN